MRDLKELQRGDLLWIIEKAMNQDEVTKALNELFIEKALGCRDEIDALREELLRKRHIYKMTENTMSMDERISAAGEMNELKKRISALSDDLTSYMGEVERVG